MSNVLLKDHTPVVGLKNVVSEVLGETAEHENMILVICMMETSLI